MSRHLLPLLTAETLLPAGISVLRSSMADIAAFRVSEPVRDRDAGVYAPRTPPEPLWREVLGELLRRLRHNRGMTLGEVAARAGLSPQYLSEIERGLKEPSSEMIEAVAGALGVTLVDLTLAVAETLILAGGSATAVQAPARPAVGRGSFTLAA
jgi:DNA-binding XRE family transcriptional regulator